WARVTRGVARSAAHASIGVVRAVSAPGWFALSFRVCSLSPGVLTDAEGGVGEPQGRFSMRLSPRLRAGSDAYPGVARRVDPIEFLLAWVRVASSARSRRAARSPLFAPHTETAR